MADREHMTRRGELLAALECGKTGPGRYIVEGYHLCRERDVGGTVWVAMLPGSFAAFGARYFDTMTDALEWINERLAARRG